jgi:Holliday junction DNA helicase RuvA
MYEFVEGTVATKSAGRLVIDVHGVGYDLAVPIGLAFAAPGERARVWTHFVVRDDAHVLCGFPDRATREVFRLLLSVTGVGPVMALSILSGIGKDELIDAIANDDAAPLVKIKGIGKRTADQILLDLGDKARKLRAQKHQGADGVLVPACKDAVAEDAVAALVSIGYSEKEAKKSVEKALAKPGPRDLESVLRVVLSSG